MDYILPFVPESIKNIPTHMDFDGQKRAELNFQVVIVLFAAVGFGYGYFTQYFSHTIYILFVGVALSALMTLFPWSTYRNQPLQWQPARVSQGSEVTTSPSAATQSKGKKKKQLKD